jgi:MFS family permease
LTGGLCPSCCKTTDNSFPGQRAEFGVSFIYCLQSLDKNTLSYAAVFGLISDAGLKGDQYSWLGSVVYVAQLVFQPLVAYILVKFPVGKFLAFMVFAWGAILCGMTAANNFTGLLVSRLFLGIFESGVGMFLPVLSLTLEGAFG